MWYKTGDLAKLLGVDANTIRRYEKNGYAVPTRDESNYRKYRENDIYKIALIRLYRKYGFCHDEIENMHNGSYETVARVFNKRLCETEAEIERLKRMKKWLCDSLTEMKSIEENEGYYIDFCSEYRYVMFNDGSVFLRERERLEVLNRFMYDSPAVHMVQLWRLDDIKKGRLSPPPTGWAVERSEFDKFNFKKESKFIKTYPVRKCLFGVMNKHPKNFDATDKHTRIAEEYFKAALDYMAKNGLTPAADPMGIVENSLSQRAGVLVCIPLE